MGLKTIYLTIFLLYSSDGASGSKSEVMIQSCIRDPKTLFEMSSQPHKRAVKHDQRDQRQTSREDLCLVNADHRPEYSLFSSILYVTRSGSSSVFCYVDGGCLSGALLFQVKPDPYQKVGLQSYFNKQYTKNGFYVSSRPMAPKSIISLTQTSSLHLRCLYIQLPFCIFLRYLTGIST